MKSFVRTLYVTRMTTPRKDTQLNIRVDLDLVKGLRKLAEIEVTTLSQLVRKAVTVYLRNNLEDERNNRL